MEIYVVKTGDTVDRIAEETGIGAEQIIYDNQLVYPYELAVGQALLINDYVRNASRAISVSGYAYPFISRWVLEQTLPYLSELPVFSYGFTSDGELIPPEYGDDMWMIELALRSGTRPVLTLTPFGADGNFNNQLIHSVVNEEAYRENLIDNLLRTMEEKGYHTSVALAPKTSSDQKGLLYEGKDYQALGEAADHVLLMTYEWGYTYGPPMAVAPIDQVRRVVEYALTQIPGEKIDLGIPNYGYDWPLPYERGVTKAATINNVQAVRIAVEQGAEIRFNELAQSPYFTYVDNGTEHEVWFEDVRSLQAKFDLIKEYGLRGCGYWQIIQWFRANWLLLYSQFYILK